MDGGTDTLDGSEDWGAVLNTQIFADNPSSHNAPRGLALYLCPYQSPRPGPIAIQKSSRRMHSHGLMPAEPRKDK